MNVQLTSQELNTLLHGLYLLEDQSWFTETKDTEKLIKKLNDISQYHKLQSEAVCDI